MNRKTLIALWVTIILLVLTWLFPLHCEYGHWAELNRYDHWIPNEYYFSWFDDPKVGEDDYKRTRLIILLIGAGLMVTFWRKRG